MTARDEDIHVDLMPILMDMSVTKLTRVANLAMNRLTLREWGEIFYAVDLRVDMQFVDPPPPPETTP